MVPVLPVEMEFVHAEELAGLYPLLTSKEREEVYVKDHGAAFIIVWHP
jgi:aspartate--ammonia ligase